MKKKKNLNGGTFQHFVITLILHQSQNISKHFLMRYLDTLTVHTTYHSPILYISNFHQDAILFLPAPSAGCLNHTERLINHETSTLSSLLSPKHPRTIKCKFTTSFKWNVLIAFLSFIFLKGDLKDFFNLV